VDHDGDEVAGHNRPLDGLLEAVPTLEKLGQEGAEGIAPMKVPGARKLGALVPDHLGGEDRERLLDVAPVQRLIRRNDRFLSLRRHARSTATPDDGGGMRQGVWQG
jgi:hypothetical protein